MDTYPLQRRLHLATLHARDKTLQAIEMAYCRQSVVHFCNDWCWTFDPRLPPSLRDVPFDLFAIQMEFLLWIRERQQLAERTQMKAGGVAPKSRERGVTWLCCVYAAHQWLFFPGSAIGFGSLKLEEVDEVGNMNTILEKIRYILRRLPIWMMPKGFVETKHATHAKIINPANAASIVAEGGENLGRGGKGGLFFLDEASHIKDSDSVNSALSANTHCRIDLSTYRGAGGDFYKKCYGGDYVPFNPSDPEIHQFSKFSLHWRDDPRTSEAWADAIKKEIGPVNFAEQYDMDPHASLENIAIPSIWVDAAVNLELPEGEGPIYGGLDCAGEGVNRTALITRRGPVVREPNSWNGLDTTQSSHNAVRYGEKQGIVELKYDVSGLGIGYKAAWKAMETPPKFKTIPINGGESPTDTKWPDGKTSKELFVNRRAEEWWKVRARFEKAYEFRKGIAQHPPDEMISIPNNHELIAQLSAPLYETRESGKIQMEGKKAMRSRGVASPDLADSLVLCFTSPPKKKKAVWW